jgi:protein TonB
MAYADQEASGRKITAIVIVVLLHAALAYAFITGLAFQVIKKAAQDLKTFDVQEEPPPPPEKMPPPPPVPKNLPPPPIVAPPPIVQTQAPTNTIVTVRTPPPAPIITPQAPQAPPPPSVASPASIKGDQNFGITDEDYPSAAQRAGEQGTTRFSYDVTPDGRMANCNVVQSSGSSSLDTTTCMLAMRRARFKPAKDASGNPIGSHMTRSIRWVLPKD